MLNLFLQWVEDSARYQWKATYAKEFPQRPPELEDIPSELHPQVAHLLRNSGIRQVYSHQAEAIRVALSGKNVVLCTETASGKTLAFHAPVMDRLTRDPDARALFLFPLKALERDQRDAFLSLAGQSGLTAAVYDGDTPESERRKIKTSPPRVLITNPDMLHLGVLPYHYAWRTFLGNLSYIVLDEVHTYKGIFGSHISQVLLRILRVCRTYRAEPQFIACSATISNPGTFVSRLIGQEVEVVTRSGAPCSERHFVFVNPILSPYTVAARFFAKALESGLKTIVFTRARRITELITTWVLQESPQLRGRISSYRAGFLPEERREIEAKLFSGAMDGVISTSALEMGIDVGGLDLCILVGYPGTIINTWQRGGRVGRGQRPSAIVMIAGSDALDQYFIRNPEDFFERNCEEAVLDPANREVLKRHLPCAAAETPIMPDEEWIQDEDMRSLLDELEQSSVLARYADGSWRAVIKRPHRDVDLRGIGSSFSIFMEDGNKLIGSSAGARVFTECHEGAVYLHRARQYVVTKLDLKRQNAFVKPERVGYYTRALSEKDTEILRAPIRSREFPGFSVHEANLKVTERIIGYEKRRTSGQELIGIVDLNLPPLHFETVGIWIEIPDKVKKKIRDMDMDFMGGIHAMEHAAISMFPLFALCDRDDIGGISTPEHPQVCRAAVFIYDGHAGGVGLSHRAFDIIEELLHKTRILVEKCPCETGCPSCIHSPKCGSGNKPLDKTACLLTLEFLLNPESLDKPVSKQFPVGKAEKKPKTIRRPAGSRSDARQDPSASPRSKPVIFPDLAETVLEQEKPPMILSSSSGVAIFDLETQRLAEDVGGWRNIHKMGLSIAVVHTEQLGFVTFTEKTVQDLISLLKQASLVVGFNHMRFDYEVLRPYTDENLRGLPNLDILAHVEAALGHRLSLDHLAEFTLGEHKSGKGTDAVKWFREGRMDLLEEYCRDDVRITRDLYRFGLANGFLRHRTKNGNIASLQVGWR